MSKSFIQQAMREMMQNELSLEGSPCVIGVSGLVKHYNSEDNLSLEDSLPVGDFLELGLKKHLKKKFSITELSVEDASNDLGLEYRRQVDLDRQLEAILEYSQEDKSLTDRIVEFLKKLWDSINVAIQEFSIGISKLRKENAHYIKLAELAKGKNPKKDTINISFVKHLSDGDKISLSWNTEKLTVLLNDYKNNTIAKTREALKELEAFADGKNNATVDTIKAKYVPVKFFDVKAYGDTWVRFGFSAIDFEKIKSKVNSKGELTHMPLGEYTTLSLITNLTDEQKDQQSKSPFEHPSNARALTIERTESVLDLLADIILKSSQLPSDVVKLKSTTNTIMNKLGRKEDISNKTDVVTLFNSIISSIRTNLTTIISLVKRTSTHIHSTSRIILNNYL